MDAKELLEKSTEFWLNEQMRNQLKAYRKDVGMTQTEVGHAIGKDQVFVSNCESGRRRINPIELLGFLEVYDKDMTELFETLDYEEAQDREYRPTG